MMGKNENTQSGFAALQIVLITVIIGIIGFTGWYVWHAKQNADKSLDSNSSTAPTYTQKANDKSDASQTAQDVSQSLAIQEWGVQLTLDNDTSSMYYVIKPNLPHVAYLSLKTISGIAPDCAADDVSLGAISQLTEDEQQSVTKDPSLGQAGTIHIGDYWYAFSNPQAGCGLSESESSAIEKALPNFNRETIGNTFKTLKQTN
jgi:hypothetical protein